MTAEPRAEEILRGGIHELIGDEDSRAEMIAAVAELVARAEQAEAQLREIRSLVNGPHDGQPRTPEWYYKLRDQVDRVAGVRS